MREEQERSGGRELLALKEHRGAGTEQEIGGQGAQATGVSGRGESLAAARVGDLIVVLQIVDEAPGLDAARRRAAPRLLPRVDLTLKQVSTLRGGHELLGRASVVAEIRLGLAGQRHVRRMMEVVVPDAIEPVPADLEWPDEPGVLRLVLGDDDRAAAARRRADAPADLRQEVRRGVVVDGVGGVEPQPVELVLVDPVAGVGQEELADPTAARAVEIDRLAPVGLVSIGEVGVRELRQVVSVRPHVVVDDVEHHAETKAVRAIDEGAQIVGRPVGAGRREEVHAVVAPPEVTREVRDRHHLDHAADAPQPLERRGGRPPRALPGERADVHLVEDLPLDRDALPCAVGPAVPGRIDDLRRAMGPFGLIARRRVRVELAAVEPQLVSRPFLHARHVGAEIAVRLRLEG